MEGPENDQTGVLRAFFQAVVQQREKGEGWQLFRGRSEAGVNANLGFLIWVTDRLIAPLTEMSK